MRGGRIVHGIDQDPTVLVPGLTADVASQTVGSQMFEPLVAIYPDNSLVPVLAESLPAIGADQTTFTVKLRRDVRWTDGTPFTADDVLFTYRLQHDPAYESVSSPLRTVWVQNVESVTAEGPHTVVLRTRGVYASYQNFFALPVLPAHVLSDLSAAEFERTPFRQAPTATTGPFRFVRWDRGREVVLERNRLYDRGPVHLDGYVFRVFPGAAAVAGALGAGELDAGEVDPTEIDRVRQNAALDIVSLPSNSYNFIGFQLDEARPASRLFADKRVRQALAHAIDRRRLVEAVYLGYADVQDSVVPRTSWGFDAGVTPRYDHDPAKAERLLDAAGWARGPSGTRQKDGLSLRFELLRPVGSPTTDGLVEAVQEMWRQVGVEADLRSAEQVRFVTTLSSTRDFEAATSTVALGNDPAVPFTLVLSSAALNPGGLNFMGYRNPEVDAALARAAGTLDRQAQRPIFDRLQRLVAADVPLITTVSPRILNAVDKRVRNLVRHQTLIAAGAWVSDRR